MMDDNSLFERMHASLREFYRVIAGGAHDSQLIDRNGITAAIVPSTPDRSVCNGVVYGTSEDLEGSLDELAAGYSEGGIRAWTVWAPGSDRESVALLKREGHRFDADPAAMACELEDFRENPNSEVDIDPEPSILDVGRINDVAYGYDGDFTRSLAELPQDAAHLYVARLAGEPVASTAAFDHAGDCCITFVATLPEARGRGLATALMTQALLDARARGCTTTSLQATKLGQPIYERMGYRDLGPLQMWEKRAAP
jgi:GNAT superfamily N-acetyltransferase